MEPAGQLAGSEVLQASLIEARTSAAMIVIGRLHQEGEAAAP
jgi:hypothetical protein